MKNVYSAAKAREEFSKILNMVAFMGNSVVVERYGEPVVKIIPIGDDRKKEKDYAKLAKKYKGMWKDKEWAEEIGKRSRYFRKRFSYGLSS